MEIADILERAADRLSKPGAWTQRALARDSRGLVVTPQSPEASCWCLSGVLLKEAGSYELAAFNAVESVINQMIPTWNDRKSRRKGQVVAALRKAAIIVRERAA